MFRKRRLMLLSAGLILAILAGGLSVGVAMGQGAGQVTSNVTVAMRGANVTDNTVSFSITIANKGTADIGGLQIIGVLPENTSLVESYAGEKGTNPGVVQEGRVAWHSDALAAGAGNGPYVFVVKKSDPVQILVTNAEVVWSSPDQGTVVSANAEVRPTEAAVPRRGCGPAGCHSPDTRYNLVTEAKAGAEDRGIEHPTLPSPEEATIYVCLSCHAPGEGAREGMGKAANLSLRDIVHPKHMFSFTFLEHYSGNCWSCHNVHSSGRFVLLWGQANTDTSGVPLSVPLTTVGPSEDWPENQ